MKIVKPIHPFPARMAPEIALDQMTTLTPQSLILDPMAGSGTTLRIAAECGHQAIGFDIDPLAVLISRAWTTPININDFCQAAQALITSAQALQSDAIQLPWIDQDETTKQFIDYWFDRPQQQDLRRLSYLLQTRHDPIGELLKVALCKIIITKTGGASLARDTSHSRPHRVATTNEYPVMLGFERAVARLARLFEQQPPVGQVKMERGDARRMHTVDTNSVDGVITSPPYLNAIDYMRGHKLALVWLGYRLQDLKPIRSNSVGAERAPDLANQNLAVAELIHSIPRLNELPQRSQRMFERYSIDMFCLLAEMYRVLKPEGKCVLVVGNSCLQGVFIENSRLVRYAAQHAGFHVISDSMRDLPPNRRYLPPPTSGQPSDLTKRMRAEHTLIFKKLG